MCLTPATVKNLYGDYCRVPCSKCSECKARRVSAWSFRLMQQHKIAVLSNFVTLTYGKGKDQDGVDYPRKSQNGFLTLNKRDVQLFYKRLRIEHDRYAARIKKEFVPIKYYTVGEYGGKTSRPHYHCILFNAIPELIEKAWQFGSVWHGSVTEASVGYCLKYISKGRTVPKHQRDDRQSEFSLISKGIGANYLTSNMIKWHQQDAVNRVYCTVPGGKKVSMPRYYKDRIFDSEHRGRIKQHYEIMFSQKEIRPDFIYQTEEFHALGKQTAERISFANNAWEDSSIYKI